MFCLGTFLAPLIASPFLGKSTAPEAPCPNTVFINKSFSSEISSGPPGGSLFYAFLILALITLLFGVLWIILTIVRILDIVQRRV